MRTMTQTPSSIDGLRRPLGGGTERHGEGLGTATRQARQDDAQRFQELMGGEGRATDGSTAQDGTPPAVPEVRPSPFDLFRPAGTGPVAAAPPAAGTDLQGIAAAVAERILVSDGARPGEQEVRIQLKDNVLPGTEVRLRHEGGRLVVEFVCSNADSVRFLDGQRDGLAGLLNGRLKADVEVRVTASDGTDAGGHPHDGRSRQQYVAPDADGAGA